MSDVHVHGVVPAGADPGGGVRRLVHRDVAAVVTDAGGRELRAADVVRAHWKVLEDIGARATVLPVRLGTVMADDRAVVDEFLAPEHDRLVAELDRLAGKVQLTVKGTYDEQALMRGVVERSPAVVRLRERIAGLPEAASYYQRIELGRLVASEVERSRERDTVLVLDRLRPLAVDTAHDAPGALDGAVNTAFLVEAARVDEFSRAVAELGRELAGRITLRYVGPLPPYSFTHERSAEAAAWA